MSERVTDWDDDYGLVSFRYDGELASVLDHPGEYMELRLDRLLLEVWCGYYPTPELVENIFEDFRQCCPGQDRGAWTWKNKQWMRS